MFGFENAAVAACEVEHDAVAEVAGVETAEGDTDEGTEV